MLQRPTLSDFKRQEKLPVVIVLDNVRSALNVGSAFRTADAFALHHIYLCGITATPPHREILKTALGSTDSVDWTYFPTTLEAVNYLKQNNYIVLAIEQTEQSTILTQYFIEKSKKYALIFGNEVDGVDKIILEVIDDCLEIPQFGTKHSINVAVCVGIVAWEFCKKINEL